VLQNNKLYAHVIPLLNCLILSAIHTNLDDVVHELFYCVLACILK